MSQKFGSQRVLLIDHDPAFTSYVAELIGEDVEFRAVDDPRDAARFNLLWRPDLIILDTMLKDIDVFELLDELRYERQGDVFGVLYLVQGRGAQTNLQRHGREVLGVVARNRDETHLRAQVLRALELTRRRGERVA